MPTMAPRLTFDRHAEEAVRFYVSALPVHSETATGVDTIPAPLH